MQAVLQDEFIVFHLSFAENYKAKSCGARFHPTTKKWRAKATRATAAAVLANFPTDLVDPAIGLLAGPAREIGPMPCSPDALLKGVQLRPRQRQGIEKSWYHAGFALFWVMGAGKTLSTIALANLRWTAGAIDRVLVVCPTSIKGVWSREFDKYSALPSHLQVLEAGGKLDQWGEFPVLVVGVEALSQGGAMNVAKEFVAGGKCLTVIDESSTIKNYDAKRTENCWALGEESHYRLVLTGTNVTQGLQDLFAQMYFVDPAIIGELSYYSFRNKYVVMGGFEQRKIIGYKNVDALLDRVRPFCDVVRKGDMRLPPKSYQVREVKASAEQVRACKELAREMTTKLGDKVVNVQNSLEALLRFQQIAGGFDPDGTPLSKNPKMDELLALLDEFSGKAIVWARYLPEVAAIASRLEERYPGAVLTLTGAVDPTDRQPMVNEFQENPARRFFVSNQATGGKGLTLTAATLSVYYSNTFSLEDRLQSEDRNHRIGQENEVLYIDLISDLKVDRLVATALENKQSLSAYVNEGLRIADMF
jgi:SNF2 family DNA or RNA helicase